MTTRISVYDLIKTPYFVSSVDGDIVCKAVFRALSIGEEVELSFAGIAASSMAFFTASVGELMGLFDEAFLDTHLRATDLDEATMRLMRAAMRYAKWYYADPIAYEYGLKLADLDMLDGAT